MTLKAALDALRYDAAAWENVSKEVATASTEAEGLTLTEADLSWASNPSGLLDTYAALQQKLTTLLDEGSQVFDGLSTTLDKVRTEYELSDERAAEKFKGVWDVHE
jgi:dsDNA-specific endonuclease/ATPase MutS2